MANPVPLARLCAAVLSTNVLTLRSIWTVGADPLPVKVLGVHGWPMTRDRHANALDPCEEV